MYASVQVQGLSPHPLVFVSFDLSMERAGQKLISFVWLVLLYVLTFPPLVFAFELQVLSLLFFWGELSWSAPTFVHQQILTRPAVPEMWIDKFYWYHQATVCAYSLPHWALSLILYSVGSLSLIGEHPRGTCSHNNEQLSDIHCTNHVLTSVTFVLLSSATCSWDLTFVLSPWVSLFLCSWILKSEADKLTFYFCTTVIHTYLSLSFPRRWTDDLWTLLTVL